MTDERAQSSPLGGTSPTPASPTDTSPTGTNTSGAIPSATVISATAASEERPKKPRGFAALSPEQRRACGSMGGKKAHQLGTANVFDSDTASAAGRIPHQRGTAHRWTGEQASAAGRLGAGVKQRRRGAQPAD